MAIFATDTLALYYSRPFDIAFSCVLISLFNLFIYLFCSLDTSWEEWASVEANVVIQFGL